MVPVAERCKLGCVARGGGELGGSEVMLARGLLAGMLCEVVSEAGWEDDGLSTWSCDAPCESKCPAAVQSTSTAKTVLLCAAMQSMITARTVSLGAEGRRQCQ